MTGGMFETNNFDRGGTRSLQSESSQLQLLLLVGKIWTSVLLMRRYPFYSIFTDSTITHHCCRDNISFYLHGQISHWDLLVVPLTIFMDISHITFIYNIKSRLTQGLWPHHIIQEATPLCLQWPFGARVLLTSSLHLLLLLRSTLL